MATIEKLANYSSTEPDEPGKEPDLGTKELGNWVDTHVAIKEHRRMMNLKALAQFAQMPTSDGAPDALALLIKHVLEGS